MAEVPTQVKQLLLAQVVVVILASLGLALHGSIAAYSALAGGAICVIANGYAAWRAFTDTARESAQGAVSNLYRAEAGKLVMMAAMIVAVFAGWKTVNIGAFLAGFGAALIVGAVGATFQRSEQNILTKGESGAKVDG